MAEEQRRLAHTVGVEVKAESYLVRPNPISQGVGVIVAGPTGGITLHGSPVEALQAIRAQARRRVRGVELMVSEVTWEGFPQGFTPPKG